MSSNSDKTRQDKMINMILALTIIIVSGMHVHVHVAECYRSELKGSCCKQYHVYLQVMQILITYPFWVEFGFHSWYNHDCLDHNIIHVQQDYLQ